MFEQLARIEAMLRENAPHVLAELRDVADSWAAIARAATRIADALAPADTIDGEVIDGTGEHFLNDERRP